MVYDCIETKSEGAVLIITLNRPDEMNALNSQMIQEIGDAFQKAQENDSVRAIIITGSEKAFAAGVDIKEMAQKTSVAIYLEDFITRDWTTIASQRKPVIAAVAGYALGGGCELAMMCDTIVAAENAKFGQPEITLGIIPGAGGTQRLTRAIGKAKAMDMILTGRMMDATQAEQAGLVARVVPVGELHQTVIEMAQKIASFSLPAVLMAKESVNRAFETSLQEGLLFECRTFQSTFALEDQKEGMAAFIAKRKPDFKHQ